ncbi:hypothetical protein SLEP1_g36834 [Rubroshorea leprosula]|uniref:Secreted protein n=1 Tax=Rubroshorea leprosula TaxID=152421 RepID=A0AAV5KSR8_9ROSI|nr:hypothetical protein SLEP1_g36834 [Rubroshorea leprosula]
MPPIPMISSCCSLSLLVLLQIWVVAYSAACDVNTEIVVAFSRELGCICGFDVWLDSTMICRN